MTLVQLVSDSSWEFIKSTEPNHRLAPGLVCGSENNHPTFVSLQVWCYPRSQQLNLIVTKSTLFFQSQTFLLSIYFLSALITNYILLMKEFFGKPPNMYLSPCNSQGILS